MKRFRSFATASPEARPIGLGDCLDRAILLGILRFIGAREIWLAVTEPSDFKAATFDVRDEHLDIIRAFPAQPLTEAELLSYHRQLFYWLLFR